MPLYPFIIALIFTVVLGLITYKKYEDTNYTPANDDGTIGTLLICLASTVIFGITHFAG